MFRKKTATEIDKQKINEVADRASKVLNATYFPMISPSTSVPIPEKKPDIKLNSPAGNSFVTPAAV